MYGPLPFLNVSLIEEYVQIDGKKSFKTNDYKYEEKDKIYSVVEMIKFLPTSIYDDLKQYLTEEIIPHKEMNSINIKTTISEDVSNIYGTAIPAVKQYKLQNYFLIYEKLKTMEKLAKDLGLDGQLNYLIFNIEKNTARDGADKVYFDDKIPYIINLYSCIMDRYIYPLRQIKNYDWYHEKNIDEALDRLYFIEENDTFEKTVKYETYINIIDDIVKKIFSINSKHGPFEFKYVQELALDHIFQVILYYCLLYIEDKQINSFNLFNIKTNEWRRIKISDPEINIPKILNIFINNKIKSSDIKLQLSDLIEKINLYNHI